MILCEVRQTSVGKKPLVGFLEKAVGFVFSGCDRTSHQTPEERWSRGEPEGEMGGDAGGDAGGEERHRRGGREKRVGEGGERRMGEGREGAREEGQIGRRVCPAARLPWRAGRGVRQSPGQGGCGPAQGPWADQPRIALCSAVCAAGVPVPFL